MDSIVTVLIYVIKAEHLQIWQKRSLVMHIRRMQMKGLFQE